MNRLLSKLAYDKKVAELGKMVETEAKKLQDVLDSKGIAVAQLQKLGERKAVLLGQISDLEGSIVEAKKSLEEVVANKHSVLSGIGQDAKKERDNLDGQIKEKERLLIETKQRLSEGQVEVKQELSGGLISLGKLNDKIAKTENDLLELTRTYQALKGFVAKGDQAKKEYESWLKKTSSLEEKYNGLKEKKDAEETRLVEKIKELDDLKEYLKDLHGKMGSYVQTMKDTVSWANENLKEKVPIRFNMREIAEIDFNNFNKK